MSKFLTALGRAELSALNLLHSQKAVEKAARTPVQTRSKDKPSLDEMMEWFAMQNEQKERKESGGK